MCIRDSFDTSRAYTDSEKKIGMALSDVRNRIFIATKTMADNTAVSYTHLDVYKRQS